MRKERNGLYLCEVPTGIGKSYQAAHTMEEYVKEIREEYAKAMRQCARTITDERKLIYLTPLRKNVGEEEEELKKAYENEELFEKEVLHIKSNVDNIIENLGKVTIPQDKQPFNYDELKKQVKAYNGESSPEIKKIWEDKVEEEERKFRKEIKNTLSVIPARERLERIENMEKFEASKMGVLKQFVEDVRTYLRDYIEINFETMEEMMSHDKKWEKYSIKVKENKSKVYEKEAAKRLSSHKIEIVDECNTETSKKIAVDFQAFLKKVYGVGSKLGDSVSSGTYNLRIIHNKDYYKGINDLHDEIFNKCIVQHITVENYKKCDLEKNPEFYAIIQELFIKEDIVNKQLTTFNWSETLGKSGKTWAFVSFKKDDTDKNTKKKDQYTYYRVFIAPDGKLSFDSCAGRSWMRRKDEWKNIIGYHQELIDKRKSEKRYDENIEGFFYTDINNICTIYKTNVCVYPRFDDIEAELLLLKADKELDKEQMIDALLHFKEDSPELVKKNKEDFEKFLNNLKNKEEEYVDKKAFYKDIGRGKLREGFNEYLRAEYRILLNFSKSKENLPLYDLDAMTDIHYSISGDSSGELVKYFVGSAKALNGSVARSNPIRKIIGKTLKAEEILPMLTATFVRNEQYTVIPFPYKYIREYFQIS